MAALIKSGIPMRESLNILRDQSSGLGLKEVLRRVIEDIESGTRFSEACEKHSSVFTGYYVRLLRVGESTGDMAATMQQLGGNSAGMLKAQEGITTLDEVFKGVFYIE